VTGASGGTAVAPGPGPDRLGPATLAFPRLLGSPPPPHIAETTIAVVGQAAVLIAYTPEQWARLSPAAAEGFTPVAGIYVKVMLR
jgi:hypothetical protein